MPFTVVQRRMVFARGCLGLLQGKPSFGFVSKAQRFAEEGAQSVCVHRHFDAKNVQVEVLEGLLHEVAAEAPLAAQVMVEKDKVRLRFEMRRNLVQE